jgi:hypothetical protein
MAKHKNLIIVILVVIVLAYAEAKFGWIEAIESKVNA